MLSKLLGSSKRHQFWILASSYFVFAELSSWGGAEGSLCIVKPIHDNRCPILSEFIIDRVGIIFHDVTYLFVTVGAALLTLQLVAYICSEQQSKDEDQERKRSFFDDGPLVWIGTAEPVEIFTGFLVIVGILQWFTFEKTDETLKAQQRAWIEPGSPSIGSLVTGTEPVNLTIHFRNIGKEPAIDAVVQLDEPLIAVDPPVTYSRLPGRNPVCKRAVPNPDGIVIYPSVAMKSVVYSNPPLPYTEQPLDKGSKILVVEGCIGYKTVGKLYWAGFCYYLQPVAGLPTQQWSFFPCLTRNEAF